MEFTDINFFYIHKFQNLVSDTKKPDKKCNYPSTNNGHRKTNSAGKRPPTPPSPATTVVFSSVAARAAGADSDSEEEPGEVIDSAPLLKVGEEREFRKFGFEKKLLIEGVGWQTPSLGDEVTGIKRILFSDCFSLFCFGFCFCLFVSIECHVEARMW